MKGKASLKEQVYSEIIEKIIRSEYPPRTILTEKDLIACSGVSKSPVRDALIELCNEGVLRSIPRYGYEVIQLTERDVHEIIQFRYLLESQCLLEKINSITAEEIRQIKEYIVNSERVAHSATEVITHWENNMEFHLLLNSFSQNQYIYNMLKKSMTTQLRAYAQFHWDKWHKTQFSLDVDTHKFLVDALLEKDAEKMLDYLRQDLGLLEFHT